MAPKKKSAFNYFIIDFREEEEAKGNEMPQNFKELAALAAPKWAAASEGEKRHYRTLAKANDGERLDCTGRKIAEVEREEEELEQREPRMLKFVEKYLNELGSSEEVIREKFYIISFNVFCVTREKCYVPAEVGLVEFSVENGITKQFQCFIEPGDLPLGYASAIRQKCEDTHQIPVQGRDENGQIGRMDGSVVMDGIVDFIDPDSTLDQYPPIFCKTEELEQTKFVLDYIQRRSRRKVDFYVVDFACLFLMLYKYVSDGMISIGLIRDYLCSSMFTFSVDCCCQWHLDKDCAQHCALNVVKCCCFIMSDHICDLYDVVVIPNQHLPAKPTDEIVTLRPSLVASSRSSSAMYLDRSRASSQSSITLPSTPCSMPSKNSRKKNDNDDQLNANSVLVNNETVKPVPLIPLREPRTQSFAIEGATSRAIPVGSHVLQNEGSNIGGARPKWPTTNAASSERNLAQLLPKGRGFGRGRPVAKNL